MAYDIDTIDNAGELMPTKRQVALTHSIDGTWTVTTLDNNGVWVVADPSRTSLTREAAEADLQAWIDNGNCERVADRDL